MTLRLLIAFLSFAIGLWSHCSVADTWTSADSLHDFLKDACEESYMVEEAITDSKGNEQRDQSGSVKTKFVTRYRINHSCVPSKFPNLYLETTAEFQEVEENTFESNYVIYDAGVVDLKCKADDATMIAYQGAEEGVMYRVSGRVLEWEWNLREDDFVMNCN